MSAATQGAYRNVARVTRTIGRKGEVKIVAIGDLPFTCFNGMEMFLTPPPLRGVYRARVVSARALPDGQAVRFEGVDDDATAFSLVGKTCLVSVSVLPDAGIDADDSDIIDCPVWDTRQGDIGVVTAVLSNGAQDILVVVNDANHETLIPFVDEFVHEKDDRGRITVSLPNGLFDLND